MEPTTSPQKFYCVALLHTASPTPVCTYEEFVQLLHQHRPWEAERDMNVEVNGVKVNLQMWTYANTDDSGKWKQLMFLMGGLKQTPNCHHGIYPMTDFVK